MYYSNDRIV